MVRVGDCFDNAMAESFFATLEWSSSTDDAVIKLELSYLTLYNGECEETRWSFA